MKTFEPQSCFCVISETDEKINKAYVLSIEIIALLEVLNPNAYITQCNIEYIIISKKEKKILDINKDKKPYQDLLKQAAKKTHGYFIIPTISKNINYLKAAQENGSSLIQAIELMILNYTYVKGILTSIFEQNKKLTPLQMKIMNTIYNNVIQIKNERR